jgi:uncharacterized RDD family membrane protein YckC
MTRPIRYPDARALQGRRAGFVSRVVADALDLAVVWVLGLSALLFAGVVRYLVTGPPFRMPVLPVWLDGVAGAAIAVGYLTVGWASTGRTVGKQVSGLRVLEGSGGRLRLRRALVRAVLYTVFPAGLLWVLVSRHNASLQDHLVGTAVVYDWSYRHAGESPPLGDARSPSPASGSEPA